MIQNIVIVKKTSEILKLSNAKPTCFYLLQKVHKMKPGRQQFPLLAVTLPDYSYR